MSKIAWIFPGQGAQKAGMGKDFYAQSETVRTIYDRAGELLDLDMKALCFEENEKLDQTEYTQAALVTTCLSIAAVLQERGLQPDVTAGLSLGEYCAIAVAGGMKTEDAVTVTRKRGIYMQNAAPDGIGAMAAVLGPDSAVVEQVLEGVEGASVANYNCPGQTVITGYRESVERAAEKLKEAGAKRVAMLNVSGPFHSPLLENAGRQLAEELEKVNLSELKIPYVTNVTAEYITDIGQTKELLAKQVSASVRWQQSVENMIADGVDTFVEIGPGKTLAGFMKRIDRSKTVYNVSTWEDIEKIVAALGK